MQDVIEYYKNFDVSNAKEVKPRFLQKLHALKNQQTSENEQAIVSQPVKNKAIDSDILSWITIQEQPVIDDINALLRLYMRAKMV